MHEYKYSNLVVNAQPSHSQEIISKTINLLMQFKIFYEIINITIHTKLPLAYHILAYVTYRIPVSVRQTKTIGIPGNIDTNAQGKKSQINPDRCSSKEG